MSYHCHGNKLVPEQGRILLKKNPNFRRAPTIVERISVWSPNWIGAVLHETCKPNCRPNRFSQQSIDNSTMRSLSPIERSIAVDQSSNAFWFPRSRKAAQTSSGEGKHWTHMFWNWSNRFASICYKHFRMVLSRSNWTKLIAAILSSLWMCSTSILNTSTMNKTNLDEE